MESMDLSSEACLFRVHLVSEVHIAKQEGANQLLTEASAFLRVNGGPVLSNVDEARGQGESLGEQGMANAVVARERLEVGLGLGLFVSESKKLLIGHGDVTVVSVISASTEACVRSSQTRRPSRRGP